METFQRDTEYIIRQAGLETLLLNKVPKSKDLKISNRSSRNETNALIPKWVEQWKFFDAQGWRLENISRYFSQIDEETLTKVLEIYQLDFDLFDYDSSKYSKMVQKNKIKTLDGVVNNRLDLGVEDEKSRVYS